MPKYLIERELPGAGALSADKVEAIARKSVEVLTSMGPAIQWVQSYIVADALYCVYIAPSEEVVRKHACAGGFPVTRVMQIVGSMDPTTAEGTRR